MDRSDNTKRINHFLPALAKLWNCIPIILQNSWKASMNYLLLPYFAIASFGFVLNKSIAFMYYGFVNSLLIFSFPVTCYRKLFVIHCERVYYRQLFIFIAYCTYFIYRGFDFLDAFISGIFYYFGFWLLPPPKNPFLKPPKPSPCSLASFYFFFSILMAIFSTFLFKLYIYFFCSYQSRNLGSGFA